MKTIDKVITLSVLVIALASCSTFAPEPTATPISTETSLPTLTNTPKPTNTPTATLIPPTETPAYGNAKDWLVEEAEIKVQPNIVEVNTTVASGVQIIATFGVDESLVLKPQGKIREIVMPQQTAAKYITKAALYPAAQNNGFAGTYEEFMDLLGKLQAGDASVDASSVNGKLWVDVLGENGVAQKPVIIRPFLSGETAGEEENINKVVVYLVNGKKYADNLTIVSEDFEQGFGIKLDNKTHTLYVYIAPAYGSVFVPGTTGAVIARMSMLPWFIRKNIGTSFSYTGFPGDQDIEKDLKNGGFSVR